MKNISVIAGMPRTATTFLYYTLGNHPLFFVPPRKELEFFSLNFHRGSSWYLDFFSKMPENNIGFDISPLYFFSSEAANRIVDFFYRPRVILIVRKPDEFAVSFFKNRIASTNMSISFDTFLGGFNYQKDSCTMAVSLDPGSIQRNILGFSQALGDNLLLIDYSTIQQDPLPALKRIENHLGTEDFFGPGTFSNRRINANSQRNIRFMNRLMHAKWFSDLVIKLFPKRIIMAVRLWLQSTADSRGCPPISPEEGDHLRQAQEHFAGDDAFIRKMFGNDYFVLGSDVRPPQSSASADQGSDISPINLQ